jgi:hypothetical protein
MRGETPDGRRCGVSLSTHRPSLPTFYFKMDTFSHTLFAISFSFLPLILNMEPYSTPPASARPWQYQGHGVIQQQAKVEFSVEPRLEGMTTHPQHAVPYAATEATTGGKFRGTQDAFPTLETWMPPQPEHMINHCISTRSSSIAYLTSCPLPPQNGATRYSH